MNQVLYQQIVQGVVTVVSIAFMGLAFIIAWKQYKLQRTEVREQNGKMIELLQKILQKLKDNGQ